ncbi:hypothetical protein BGZ61DRAFT_464827 [Ilyonectria robusta]|uniref:uncharacterized protein n=1 Tax=Ilyonectria robusta TaxID=1079257 RepID=UPI001E8E4085|nr:uncharacterized protein BGZ61DRAFT_464827 [Ilyonectria robusta]KAH8659668.1 hypothetical protein BGZ61DRAFT_464827 [Ilyonectria robusta]
MFTQLATSEMLHLLLIMNWQLLSTLAWIANPQAMNVRQAVSQESTIDKVLPLPLWLSHNLPTHLCAIRQNRR